VLHARWRAEAAEHGLERDTLWRQVTAAAQQIHRQRTGPDRPMGWVVADAVTAAGRARSAFSRAELVIEIAGRLPAVPATAEQIREAVERLTDTGLTRGGAVYLGAPGTGTPPGPPTRDTPPESCSPPRPASSPSPRRDSAQATAWPAR